ncbi:MAG: hypothetical protein ACJ75B_17720 [Flavisolibacter sp.]
MKSALPFLSAALIFASCTTAYKSGQTPDDVYYSPARPLVEKNNYTSSEKKHDQEYRYDEEAYRDDRYLRMKIRDRRYDDLYDDYYSYNPYYYHYYNGILSYNSPWTSYSYWNYYYNPYCHQQIIVAPGTKDYSRSVFNKPRTFDLSVYNPQQNSSNSKTSKGYGGMSTYSPGTYNNNNNNYRGSGSNAGNFLRNAFGGSSSNSSSSSNAGTRSVPSSSSTPSSSGSSGGHSGGGTTNAAPRRF